MRIWTEEEERRLAPYVLRRVHPYYLASAARDLGKHRAEVCRHRRVLRRNLRRAHGLAARPGRLAA